MEEKSLKTSVWQRIVILVVAVLLIGSMIGAYMLIVLGGSNSTSSSGNSAELEKKLSELSEKFDAKNEELNAAAEPLGKKYFDGFKGYKSSAKAYNAASANAEGLKTKDLKAGTGKTLAEGDTNYLAYYLGWCPDGSIFSSTFNDNENPTAFTAPFDPSVGTIEGWKKGVVGMKLGGVRQITMSGDLAYGDTQEICGTKGSPLKFIIMPIERDEKIVKILSELTEIQMQIMSLYYGAMGAAAK